MLRSLRDDVAEHHRTVMEEIGGGERVRREDSLRGRLHYLENDRAASQAAARALAEAQRERALARRDREHVAGRSRAQFWRWVGATIAVAAILAPYIARGVTVIL